jgi:hypothetical protein
LLGAAVLAVGLTAPVTNAAGKAGRVGVVVLRGAGEGVVRAKITKALKANGFQVVGGQQLESTASGLSVSLDSDAGFKAVAKELNISAFVAGELTRKKAGLVVRNGADGVVLGDASFSGANPKKIAAQVGANFWRQLGPAVRQGKPPSGAKTKAAIAEEAPPPEEEEASPPPPPEPRKKSKKAARAEAESTTEPAPGKAGQEGEAESKPSRGAEGGPAEDEGSSPARTAVGPALTLGVGGRALFRRLDWNQDIARVPPYSLSPGPQASLWLEAYPAAMFSKGFAGNVGVFGDFNLGFGVSSTTTDGAKLTTKFQNFLGGVKVRLPVNAFTPYASLAYGAQSFSLESSNGTASVVPSVAYKFLRVGLGTRVAIGSIAALDVGAAYLLVTDPGSKAGEIKSQDFFPNTKANALDVGVSVSYRLMKRVGLRAGVDFRQYGLDLKVTPQSPLIVGGATDRYITAGAGVEIMLDGLGGGGAAAGEDHEAEAEPPPTTKKKAAEE